MLEVKTNMAKRKRTSRGRVSITHTVIAWTGLFLAIFGALVAALGMGGVTTFTLKWKDVIELSSTSIGIIIMVTGVILALYQVNHLPKGIEVLTKTFK